jgi:hypothetical protein
LIGNKEREKAILLSKDSNGNLRLEKITIQVTNLVTAESPLFIKIQKTPRDNKVIRLLDNKNTKEANSLILWKGIVYVPKNLREEVLRENYNNLTAEYFEND